MSATTKIRRMFALAGWEIDYLVAEAARVLPGLGIEHRNVLYAYSGVRPLTRAGEGVFEGAISRRSIIADHAAEGVQRLVSVVGGKLTTAAELGRNVAEAVAQQIGRPRARGIAALPETPTSRTVFLPPETQEASPHGLRTASPRSRRIRGLRCLVGPANLNGPP